MDFNMASNVTASQMQQEKQFKRPRKINSSGDNRVDRKSGGKARPN